MKKTYTISVGGKVFHIEEDAYNKLQTYINTLTSHYSKEQDGSEIISDIEIRIAELFHSYQKEFGREVVTIEDVSKVISVMGTPNEIFDEEDTENKNTKKEEPVYFRPGKKLYRNPDNSIFGGVASGLALYLGIPVLFIRIVFIAGLFLKFTTAVVYIILWIVIPKARTINQKLEMRGQNVDVSNIEKSLREEFSNIANGKAGRYVSNFNNGASKFIDSLGGILKIIVGVIVFIIGISFLITAASLILAFSLVSIYPFWPYLIFKIGLILSFLIPAILIIYAGLKLLLNFKSSRKNLLLTLIIVWLISVFSFIFIAGRDALQGGVPTKIENIKIWNKEIFKGRKTKIFELNLSPLFGIEINRNITEHQDDEVIEDSDNNNSIDSIIY